MKPGLEDIRGNPTWFLMNLNLAQRRCQFIRLPESSYYESSFLDRRLMTSHMEAHLLEIESLYQAYPQETDASGATAYIFHVGHCGSTLLSRALATKPNILPLREPLTFRVLGDSLRQIEMPTNFISKQEWIRLKTSVLECHSRQFRSTQLPMIKLTSTCNNLIEPLLLNHADRRGLFMFVSLECYLATMLNDSEDGARILDGRWQAPAAIEDWINLVGLDPPRFTDLSHEELLAIAWLMNMQRFLEAAKKLSADQFCFLNFDEFLESPEVHLENICRFFGVEKEISKIHAQYSEIASRYSKSPNKEYKKSSRRTLIEKAHKKNTEQIRSAMIWVENMIEKYPCLSACQAYLSM